MQKVPAHAIGTEFGLIPDDEKDAQHAQQHGWHDQLPGQAGEENDGQTGSHHQQRSAKVRLLHDEPDGNQQQHKRDHKIRGPQIAFAALKPPGQHQRRGNFQQFGRLNGHTHIHPACCAFLGDAKQGHGHQQQHPKRVKRHRHLHQLQRRHLSHHKQEPCCNQHIAGMVGKTGAVIKTRGIHGKQPCAGQRYDKQQQQEVKAAKQRNNALQQRRLVKFGGGHGPQLSWERATVCIAGLSFADKFKHWGLSRS